MSLEDRGAQHDKIIVDKYHGPNADYQMTTRDYVLRPEADGTSGAITITLPAVSEAKGRFYSIICRNADAVNTVTIQDQDESECWANDIVLNGKCDRLFLYSDGLAWMPAFSGGFPQASTTYPPGTTPTPTTLAPTTLAPTTAAPTTIAPTTIVTTLAPTTA